MTWYRINSAHMVLLNSTKVESQQCAYLEDVLEV